MLLPEAEQTLEQLASDPSKKRLLTEHLEGFGFHGI